MGVSLERPVTLTGNVYSDSDGATNINGTGVGSPSGTQLYATLIDGSGKTVQSVAVSAGGGYSFTGTFAGNYTVSISTTIGIQGTTAPTASIPASWTFVGEDCCDNTGNDGTSNGSVAIVVSSDMSDINFGINNDNDGDGISNNIDIDDDNDGVLDSDEGGQICASAVTVSLNTVPYAFNSLLNTSTTQSPVNINNLLFGSLNYTGTLVGSATWNAASGVAPNNGGGVQIKNNSVPTVGHYIYMQPVSTNTTTLTGANTNNYAKYELVFPTAVTGFSFISAGLNNGDTYEIYAFNGATAVPLNATNLSGFSPALGVDWEVYDLGDGMKVVGKSALGGTDVDTNIFITSIDGTVTRIEIRSYKNETTAPNAGSRVTSAVTSFQYCTVTPYLDTDSDGIPNYLDLDSDDDGCSDANEAGATTDITANFKFVAPFGVNGLADSKETATDSGVINYTVTYTNATNAGIKACCPAPQCIPLVIKKL
jgi:hypothetical protein